MDLRTYRELLRQEHNFSPLGTTFEREDWAVAADVVTPLRLVIKPDKGGKSSRATITSLALVVWTGNGFATGPPRRGAWPSTS